MSSRKKSKKEHLEKQREQSRQAHAQFQQRHEQEQRENAAQKSKKLKMWIIAGVVSLVIVVAIAYVLISYAVTPGPYDEFAQCLTAKGAVMYGADFCQYTQGQRAMFGKSFKYVDYRDYTEGPNIKITPTWVIDGKSYEKAQAFDRLAYLTGCKV